MGYTPQQVRAMSMFQYFAALDGFVKANFPEDKSMTKQEEDELWAWLEDEAA